MKIYTLNGRRQYPNWMAGRMGAGPETGWATGIGEIGPEGVPAGTDWAAGAPASASDAQVLDAFGKTPQQNVADAGKKAIWRELKPVWDDVKEWFFNDVFGPSYDPNNGGELRRALPNWSEPAITAYATWLKVKGGGDAPGTPYANRWHPNRPPAGQPFGTGYDIWANDGFNPSRFNDELVLTMTQLNRPGVSAVNFTGPGAGEELVPLRIKAPAPNADEFAALQSLAVALAGYAGAELQTQAVTIYAQLPNSWRALVDAMVAQLLAASPTPPPIPPMTPPRPTTTTAGGMLLPLVAVGAAVLLLTRK